MTRDDRLQQIERELAALEVEAEHPYLLAYTSGTGQCFVREYNASYNYFAGMSDDETMRSTELFLEGADGGVQFGQRSAPGP